MGGSELPSLREDLRLLAAAPNRDGSPAWMIQDPVGNRFFRIGWVEFEALSRWALRDAELVARAVSRETPLAVSAAQIARVADFLIRQHLVATPDASSVSRLAKNTEKSVAARLRWLLHHYLFFRVPLIRPQRWLQAIAPWSAPFYTTTFAWLTVVASVIGITLAIRQWDAFLSTFTNFMSPAGVLGWALALIFAKALHELGHAVTATRLGVRVAHMGVAFLVLWPMLYTDTGESWKLTRRMDRFRIAAAGMASEFALAGYATLAWSLLPDGPVRSAVFFLATTSWIVTLGINASPFMRFDGYFLLSDALDFPNLHARSFAMARTNLRRVLFGWADPYPEPMEAKLRRFLIGFAWLTWAYRLAIFIAIAVAVYVFFFKALGIILFIVEIAWFIVRPLNNETKIWWQRRHEIGAARGLFLAVLVGLAIAALAIPWRQQIQAQGWLHAARSQVIYSPFAARVQSLHAGGDVRAGELLVSLDAPELRARIEGLNAGADALRNELAGTVGRLDGAWRRNLLIETLARENAELASTRDELSRLRLSAAFDGRLLDRDRQIANGSWVSARQPLAVLVDPQSWVVDALVAQEDIQAITLGAKARFYPKGDAGSPMRAEVDFIDRVRMRESPDPALLDVRGGPLASTRDERGELILRDPLYRVRLRLHPDENIRHERVSLGTVQIDGDRLSPLTRWTTHALSVLIRESGF